MFPRRGGPAVADLVLVRPMPRPACRNCHSHRRAVYRNGYCGKCYTPSRKLSRIETWNLDRPETLVYYPNSAFWRTSEYFDIFKTQFASQARSRLGWLRSREEMYVGGATGILVERQLRSLSLRAGCRRELHYGSATRIDHMFDQASKRELFRMLYEIEEQLPWCGLSLGRALDQHERAQRSNQAMQQTAPRSDA